MNKSFASRAAAFGFAAVLTLAVLAGLDRLAAQQYGAALAAASQAAVAAVAATAPHGSTGAALQVVRLAWNMAWSARRTKSRADSPACNCTEPQLMPSTP